MKKLPENPKHKMSRRLSLIGDKLVDYGIESDDLSPEEPRCYNCSNEEEVIRLLEPPVIDTYLCYPCYSGVKEYMQFKEKARNG